MSEATSGETADTEWSSVLTWLDGGDSQTSLQVTADGMGVRILKDVDRVPSTEYEADCNGEVIAVDMNRIVALDPHMEGETTGQPGGDDDE